MRSYQFYTNCSDMIRNLSSFSLFHFKIFMISINGKDYIINQSYWFICYIHGQIARSKYISILSYHYFVIQGNDNILVNYPDSCSSEIMQLQAGEKFTFLSQNIMMNTNGNKIYLSQKKLTQGACQCRCCLFPPPAFISLILSLEIEHTSKHIGQIWTPTSFLKILQLPCRVQKHARNDALLCFTCIIIYLLF